MKADHWEIMTTNFADVQDYGTSDFKGRPLDTALARVTIRLKNAILGEYKDACFVFGRIVDPEFNMTREALRRRLRRRRRHLGHVFHSRWIVGEPTSVSSPSAPTISGSSSPPPQPPTPRAPTKSEAGPGGAGPGRAEEAAGHAPDA